MYNLHMEHWRYLCKPDIAYGSREHLGATTRFIAWRNQGDGDFINKMLWQFDGDFKYGISMCWVFCFIIPNSLERL